MNFNNNKNTIKEDKSFSKSDIGAQSAWNDIKLVPFEEKDIPLLTKIMKAAFDYDTKIHLGKDEGGPDGYDNGSFLRKYGFDNKSTQFKITLDNQIIGAVILCLNEKTYQNYLGNIFIDVSLQNKGIGLAVWKKIKTMYPNTKVWRTETPAFSLRNHNFYVNKCGFYVVHIDNPMNPEHGSYYLEKGMK